MESARLASAQRIDEASLLEVSFLGASFLGAASRGRVMGVDMDFLLVSPGILALPEI
jgi:hypothetical protein